MKFEVGSLVESTYGKDKGQLFIIKELSDKSALLINGHNRSLKKPKLKNLKHIKLKKNCNLDFKFVNDCDIIYLIRCFESENKCGGQSSVETRCH